MPEVTPSAPYLWPDSVPDLAELKGTIDAMEGLALTIAHHLGSRDSYAMLLRGTAALLNETFLSNSTPDERRAVLKTLMEKEGAMKHASIPSKWLEFGWNADRLIHLMEAAKARDIDPGDMEKIQALRLKILDKPKLVDQVTATLLRTKQR